MQVVAAGGKGGADRRAGLVPAAGHGMAWHTPASLPARCWRLLNSYALVPQLATSKGHDLSVNLHIDDATQLGGW